MLLVDWRRVLCVQGLGLGAKHLPNVPPASQPWDLRARWQFHLNLPSRHLAFFCILFLCVLKKSKCKNTEQASSKIPCFSLRKSRVRPKCVSSSRLSKYWPLPTDCLEQDPFCLEATRCTALPLPRHVLE